MELFARSEQVLPERQYLQKPGQQLELVESA